MPMDSISMCSNYFYMSNVDVGSSKGNIAEDVLDFISSAWRWQQVIIEKSYN